MENLKADLLVLEIWLRIRNELIKKYQKIEVAFQAIDVNESGYIEIDDLQKELTNYHQIDNLDVIEGIFTLLSGDRDNTAISIEDFGDMWLQVERIMQDVQNRIDLWKQVKTGNVEEVSRYNVDLLLLQYISNLALIIYLIYFSFLENLKENQLHPKGIHILKKLQSHLDNSQKQKIEQVIEREKIEQVIEREKFRIHLEQAIEKELLIQHPQRELVIQRDILIELFNQIMVHQIDQLISYHFFLQTLRNFIYFYSLSHISPPKELLLNRMSPSKIYQVPNRVAEVRVQADNRDRDHRDRDRDRDHRDRDRDHRAQNLRKNLKNFMTQLGLGETQQHLSFQSNNNLSLLNKIQTKTRTFSPKTQYRGLNDILINPDFQNATHRTRRGERSRQRIISARSLSKSSDRLNLINQQLKASILKDKHKQTKSFQLKLGRLSAPTSFHKRIF